MRSEESTAGSRAKRPRAGRARQLGQGLPDGSSKSTTLFVDGRRRIGASRSSNEVESDSRRVMRRSAAASSHSRRCPRRPEPVRMEAARRARIRVLQAASLRVSTGRSMSFQSGRGRKPSVRADHSAKCRRLSHFGASGAVVLAAISRSSRVPFDLRPCYVSLSSRDPHPRLCALSRHGSRLLSRKARTTSPIA